MYYSSNTANINNFLRPLLFFLIILTVPANGSLYDNIVRIDIVYPDNSTEYGFGIVFSESSDSLFIISASDLLFSSSDQPYIKMNITFRDGYYTDQYRLDTWISDYQFMIFRIAKPPHFVWDELYASTDVSSGDLVLLAGRYGDLTNSSEKYQGEIASLEDRFLEIVSSSPALGKIGVPVIYNGKIAGLVINDQGSKVSAVPINIIQDYLYERLSITPEKQVLRIPYATIGLNINLNFPLSQIWNIMAATGYGAFLETGLSRTLVLRIGYSQNNFQSREFRTFDDTYEFRNKFSAYSVALQYIESSTYDDKTFSRIYFEYSYIRHNPQLKSGGTWKNLRDYNSFENDYQSNSHGITLGANTNILFDQHLIVGGEFGLQYTFTPYLHINPLEPFAQQSSNDWLIFLKLYTGFTIGNSEPQKRYLAD